MHENRVVVEQSQTADPIVSMSEKMKARGISHAFLASRLGVSRQYVWQILHRRGNLTTSRCLQIEMTIERIIHEEAHVRTLGDRLRAARRASGLTLKQVAVSLGCSWMAIERWEKNRHLPGIPLLLRMSALYGVTFEVGDNGGMVRRGFHVRRGKAEEHLLPVPFASSGMEQGATIRISERDMLPSRHHSGAIAR